MDERASVVQAAVRVPGKSHGSHGTSSRFVLAWAVLSAGALEKSASQSATFFQLNQFSVMVRRCEAGICKAAWPLV